MSDARPAESLDQLQEALRDFTDDEMAVTQAQQRVVRSRQAVLDSVASLRSATDAQHDPALVGVMRHIYWQQRGITVASLADAAGLTIHDLLKAIGPSPSGIPCAFCGVDLARTSRSWVPSQPPRCADCKTAEDQTRYRTYRIERLRGRFIGSTPVGAPAWRWRAAACLVLAYPPLTQGVQRGSESDRKEGVWLDWENARTVHDRLVHSATAWEDEVPIPVAYAHLLVQAALRVAGWDTARTRDLLDPITDESAHGLLTGLMHAVKSVVAAAKVRALTVYPDDCEPSDDEIDATWEPGPTWYPSMDR